MKKILLLAVISICSHCFCFSQTATTDSLLTEGFYIAKTGTIDAAKLDIYTYLKFYSDSTVYMQTVTSIAPQDVAKWFGRDKKFSQKGTYTVNGSQIKIEVNNKDSKDIKLEGRKTTTYIGNIETTDQICLIRDQEKEKNCFKFYEVKE